MKILYYASIDFFAKPNPSFHLMKSMIEDLLAKGNIIDFIGCRDAGAEKHIPEEFLKHKNFIYELVNVPIVKKSHFVCRYLTGFKYAFSANRLLEKYSDEVDIAFIQSSPTVLFNLVGAHRKLKGAKIIYNIQDMFPGSSIASGIMPRKWMQRVFYGLQKIAYKKADIITVISDDMKTKVMEQGVDVNKIKVIVNWFDDSTVHEVAWKNNRFVKKFNMVPDKFYVQYAGTMGYVFDYKMVLDVARKLKEHKDIVIQMIGEGSQKEAFMNEAEKDGLDNIVFLPLQTQDMVSDVYSACSVCLIPLKKGIIGNSVPSKAGLLMACRRPIITSVDSDSYYYKMFSEKGIGEAAATDDVNGIVKAILHMHSDKAYRDTCAQRGYNYGKIIYSRTYNTQKYIELFKEVTEK